MLLPSGQVLPVEETNQMSRKTNKTIYLKRLIPDKPPFIFVGVDYFGPIEVKQGRFHVKRYGCLFSCLTMRAVHIEVAHSLDTDSMINALRRFISIRGCPEQIRSDRGTNFTSAERE